MICSTLLMGKNLKYSTYIGSLKNVKNLNLVQVKPCVSNIAMFIKTVSLKHLFIFSCDRFITKCIKYFNFPRARPLTGQTSRARLKQWKKADIQQ